MKLSRQDKSATYLKSGAAKGRALTVITQNGNAKTALLKILALGNEQVEASTPPSKPSHAVVKSIFESHGSLAQTVALWNKFNGTHGAFADEYSTL